MTWNWCKFLIHFIAQISAFISAWRGDRDALTFLVPIRPSKPSRVLYQPCPEKGSLSFHDPSVKHHLPGMIGRLVASTSLFWETLCASETCASVQNRDSVFANFKVSLGSISILLKIYYFFPSKYTIISKEIDDPPFVEQLSKTNYPYSRKVMD